MSDEVQEAPAAEQKKDLGQTLLVANSIGLALLLVVALLSLVMVISLSSDLGTLEEQSRRSTKAVKALEQEVASLREALHPPASAKTEAPKPPSIPRNIDAADPGNDCVIRPGSKGGISNCL